MHLWNIWLSQRKDLGCISCVYKVIQNIHSKPILGRTILQSQGSRIPIKMLIARVTGLDCFSSEEDLLFESACCGVCSSEFWRKV